MPAHSCAFDYTRTKIRQTTVISFCYRFSTSHSMSCCPTTWRSYRDHRLCSHCTLCIRWQPVKCWRCHVICFLRCEWSAWRWCCGIWQGRRNRGRGPVDTMAAGPQMRWTIRNYLIQITTILHVSISEFDCAVTIEFCVLEIVLPTYLFTYLTIRSKMHRFLELYRWNLSRKEPPSPSQYWHIQSWMGTRKSRKHSIWNSNIRLSWVFTYIHTYI